MPKVTVLLPLFNAETFIKDAVESILNQTFTEFELLIIDDGSTDNSLAIISNITDSRIRILSHEINEGLIATLNEGILASLGEYIVRMDADDIAHPERISIQVKYMDLHNDISIAGSYFKLIDGREIYKVPLEHEAIKAQLIFHSTLAHPSVIMRKNDFIAADLFFNSDYKHAEDYELWVRASEHLKFANIPQVLLYYRAHVDQVSAKYNLVQRSSMLRCQLAAFSKIGIYPNENQVFIHNSLSTTNYRLDTSFFAETLVWLKLIAESNRIVPYYSQVTLELILFKKWMMVCNHLVKCRTYPDLKYLKKHFNVSQKNYLYNSVKLLIKIIYYRLCKK